MLPDASGSFFYLRSHGVQVFRMCSILDFRFTERMFFFDVFEFCGLCGVFVKCRGSHWLCMTSANVFVVR